MQQKFHKDGPVLLANPQKFTWILGDPTFSVSRNLPANSVKRISANLPALWSNLGKTQWERVICPLNIIWKTTSRSMVVPMALWHGAQLCWTYQVGNSQFVLSTAHNPIRRRTTAVLFMGGSSAAGWIWVNKSMSNSSEQELQLNKGSYFV